MEIRAKTADELFDKVVDTLSFNLIDYENICAEIINANLILEDPTRNTMCNCKRKMPIRYAIGELLWYNSRNSSASAIERFSTFWKKLADEHGNVNSNYGWCIHNKYTFDQWEHCKQLLLLNKNSRQAVIHIKEPRDLIAKPTKDVNCTIALQFLLRNGKLDLITTMRSNDVWLGLPYDLFNFTCMQIQMAMELGCEVGMYYHNAASLHCYKDNIEILQGGNK